MLGCCAHRGSENDRPLRRHSASSLRSIIARARHVRVRNRSKAEGGYLLSAAVANRFDLTVPAENWAARKPRSESLSHSIGVSAGSYVAASLAAVEPAVRATVMNGALASMAMLRLSPTFRGGQNGVAFWVQNRTPSILNSDHGVTSVDGITVPTNGPAFNENIPLRAPATAIGFRPRHPS